MKEYIGSFILVFIYVSLIDLIVWFSDFNLWNNLFIAFFSSFIIVYFADEEKL